MEAIRTLLYRDRFFPACLPSPYQEQLLVLRQEPLQTLHAALISPQAFRVSAFALALLLLGLITERWLS
ncbi:MULTISPECIES: hypothetical protein [unclassified Pseudomonas]|uniref:hypothetical protein n=1 Tax=unclassified Pseudomonas TaxID=196821 RepID=UPI002449EE4E|nr:MULTISPECIES: hypothetical protein [unclassified Pseudomonas]MDG9923377.1 hypothetical protein [Pseudomonas sp. GD04045]MDH0035499.1 hypothetical protein [Pseudomonas sp. GD04019]